MKSQLSMLGSSGKYLVGKFARAVFLQTQSFFIKVIRKVTQIVTQFTQLYASLRNLKC